MKNPRSFLIYNRGRRTKFHYGFNDLGARSRKNLKTPKHGDSALPPSCSASFHNISKTCIQFFSSVKENEFNVFQCKYRLENMWRKAFETNAIFLQKNARAKMNTDSLFWKLWKFTWHEFQSFCKLKMLRHAQIHIVVSQMPQKSDSAIFYKRKRCTTIF